MSSRLFQEVREERGLCYSIYSSAWGLADGGMFTVHAATGADMMGDLIDVVTREVMRSAGETPGEREVERAKAQLKAGLLMSLESSSARAEQMARQLLVYGRLLSAAELDRAGRCGDARACARVRRAAVVGQQADDDRCRGRQAFAALGGSCRQAAGELRGSDGAWRSCAQALASRMPRPIRGNGVWLRAPIDVGLRGMGGAARHVARASDAVGAAVDVRRAVANRLPPPVAPLCPRSTRGSRLRLLRVPGSATTR